MRYPLVELGCAVFFVAVGARFMPATIFTAPLNELIADLAGELAFFYLATISLTLALIDVDHRRLPNVLVLPAYAVGFVLLTIASIARGEVVPLAVALMSSVGLFVFYFILMIASRSGMGFGDVKLAGVIGLFTGYLGISVVLVATMAAFILGGLYGVGLILTRRAGRKTGVPFGPWMLAGAWLAIFWGTDIAAAYLRLFGLGES
jgi:leader peptidase (prepilin peptidase)/N-methyltransferase